MLYFLIIVFSFVSLSHGMDKPLGKRKGDELQHTSKHVCAIKYEPTLLGIPEDIRILIVGHAMSADGDSPEVCVTPEQETNVTVKGIHPAQALREKFAGIHPCFLVNKKLSKSSGQAQKQLFARLARKYETQIQELVNASGHSPQKIFFLKKFVEAIPSFVFKLAPHYTPLMAAVSISNRLGIECLLTKAKELGIEKEYVNLRTIPIGDNSADTDGKDGALGVAVLEVEVPQIDIVKRLLLGGANPNNGDLLHQLVGSYDMYAAEDMPTPQCYLDAAEELCKAGADPKLPGEDCTISAIEYAQVCLQQSAEPDVDDDGGHVDQKDTNNLKVQNYIRQLIALYFKLS